LEPPPQGDSGGPTSIYSHSTKPTGPTKKKTPSLLVTQVELRGFEPLAFSLRKLPKTNAIEPPCGSRHSPQCVACVVSPFGEHNWGTSPERATAHTPKEEAPGLPTKVE
jgi:hypothetical protein